MDRNQIENLYLVNGLGNFQLRNLGDLMKVHGINARTTEGYSTLSDEDKKAFETFIIKYFNVHGLDYRKYISLLKIYRAFNVDYLVKQEDDSWYVLGGEVWNCTEANNNYMISSWKDTDEEINGRDITKEINKSYLRIEYQYEDRKEWLHITENGTQWY